MEDSKRSCGYRIHAFLMALGSVTMTCVVGGGKLQGDVEGGLASRVAAPGASL